jgi:hypothetical protein
MFVQCIVYCVQCTPFPPVAEICARLAGNFYQYITTVSCWANSLVWVAVCYFTARVREGGGVRQLCLHSVTQPFTTWPRWREQGGGLCSLPLAPAERAETFSLFPLSPSILLGLHLGNDELKAYALCLLTLFDYKIFHRKETMLRI